jgi:hypothetical protein
MNKFSLNENHMEYFLPEDKINIDKLSKEDKQIKREKKE